MNKILIIVFSFTLLCQLALAEDKHEEPAAIPDTEIYLFDLVKSKDGYQLNNPKNISNNLGYDNQPYFTPDSQSILFVSSRDSRPTDVYEYFIKSKKMLQVTNTESQEYSPKTSPDNKTITFVRDGGSPDQTVWKIDRKSKKMSWAMNSKEPVGYYEINHKTDDVLFWSRYGWSVQYLNLKENSNRFVSGNAQPSSPQRIPNTNKFSFVHRQTNSEVWIKAFDPSTFSITPIAPIYGSNIDYTWTPAGELLRAEENHLYLWDANAKDTQWKKLQDLTSNIEGKITRLAVSPNSKFIAIVSRK